MTIGIGATAFGINEIVSGIVSENSIRDWMGDGLYDGLYLGFNIGSAIGSFAGNIYMNYADIKIFDKSLPAKGKPFSRTSLLDRKGIKQYRFYDGKGAAYMIKILFMVETWNFRIIMVGEMESGQKVIGVFGNYFYGY